MLLAPAPGYGQAKAELRASDGGVCIDGRWWLYCSANNVKSSEGSIVIDLPAGAEAWAVLLDEPIEQPAREELQRWLDSTLAQWEEIASRITYHRPV